MIFRELSVRSFWKEVYTNRYVLSTLPFLAKVKFVLLTKEEYSNLVFYAIVVSSKKMGKSSTILILTTMTFYCCGQNRKDNLRFRIL